MSNEPSSPAVQPRFYHASSRLRRALPYFIRNGPLAIASSSMPGFVNYVIIVYLSYAQSLEAAGAYRLLMSYFALCGLPTMQESQSVYVRVSALDQKDRMGALFMGQIYASALVWAGVTAAYFLLHWAGLNWMPRTILPIALATLLYYPCELFKAHAQARQQFFTLFVLTTIKWVGALLAFVIAFRATGDVTFAVMIQLGAMVVLNLAVYCYIAWGETYLDRAFLNPITVFKRQEVREGILLSSGLLLPGALEQIDKLLVGAVFGLKALGLYTLGFSTGRLLYNMLKPSLYVYYRHFVDTMPPKRLLRVVFVSFTILGAVVAVGFTLAVQHVPALAKFRGTEAVSAVLFLSYGISIVDAVYSQAYAINKDTNSVHLFIGNTASSLICLLIFLIASFMPVSIGLILFASYYPVRHGAAVAFTAYQRRRSLARLA